MSASGSAPPIGPPKPRRLTMRWRRTRPSAPTRRAVRCSTIRIFFATNSKRSSTSCGDIRARRYRAGDGAGRGRRTLRSRLVEPPVAAPALDQGEGDQCHPAGRDGHRSASCRARRGSDVELREGCRNACRARTHREPAGVRPPVHAAAETPKDRVDILRKAFELDDGRSGVSGRSVKDRVSTLRRHPARASRNWSRNFMRRPRPWFRVRERRWCRDRMPHAVRMFNERIDGKSRNRGKGTRR